MKVNAEDAAGEALDVELHGLGDAIFIADFFIDVIAATSADDDRAVGRLTEVF